MSLLRKTLFLLLLTSPAMALAEVTELDNPSLQELQEQGVAIIDVRRADEWLQTGIVEGSHGITFFDEKGRYDVNAWLDELSKHVSKEDPFVLICARGVRSSKIAELLDKRLGYAGVHNVTKGIYEWIKKEKPVVEWEKPK